MAEHILLINFWPKKKSELRLKECEKNMAKIEKYIYLIINKYNIMDNHNYCTVCRGICFDR